MPPAGKSNSGFFFIGVWFVYKREIVRAFVVLVNVGGRKYANRWDWVGVDSFFSICFSNVLIFLLFFGKINHSQLKYRDLCHVRRNERIRHFKTAF